MKVNICTINTSILNDKLHEFENVNNVKPYIICNKETQESIASAVGFKPSDENLQEQYFIATYSGHKVLTDNTLSFGIVEIR